MEFLAGQSMRIFFLEQNLFLFFIFVINKQLGLKCFWILLCFHPPQKRPKCFTAACVYHSSFNIFSDYYYSFYFLHMISNLPRAMPSLEWYPNKILGISGKRKSNCRFSANLDLISWNCVLKWCFYTCSNRVSCWGLYEKINVTLIYASKMYVYRRYLSSCLSFT